MSEETIPFYAEFQSLDQRVRERYLAIFDRIDAHPFDSPGQGKELAEAYWDLIQWDPHRRFDVDEQRYVGMGNSIQAVLANENAFVAGTLGQSEWSVYADEVAELIRPPLNCERDWSTGPIADHTHGVFGRTFDVDGAVTDAVQRAGAAATDATARANAEASVRNSIVREVVALGHSNNNPLSTIARRAAHQIAERGDGDKEDIYTFLSALGQFGALSMARLLFVREELIDQAARAVPSGPSPESGLSLLEVDRVARTNAERLLLESVPFPAMGTVMRTEVREVTTGFFRKKKTEKHQVQVPLTIEGWPLAVSRRTLEKNGGGHQDLHVVLCPDGTLAVARVTNDAVEIIRRGSFAALQVMMLGDGSWSQVDRQTRVAKYSTESPVSTVEALRELMDLCARAGTS